MDGVKSMLQDDIGATYTVQRQKLDNQVADARTTLLGLSRGHADWSATVVVWAKSICVRYNTFSASTEEINSAIEHLQEALTASDSNPDVMDTLGFALYARYRTLVTDEDLVELMQLHHASLDLRQAESRGLWASLFGLCRGYQLQYKSTGIAQSDSLTHSVEYGRRAMDCTGIDEQERMLGAAHLALSLLWRFQVQRGAGSEDLDDAVDLCVSTLCSCANDTPLWSFLLCKLAMALRVRFEFSLRVDADLRDSVTFADYAARHLLLAQHPESHFAFSVLAVSSRMLADLGGDLNYLDNALEAGQKSVELAPPGSPERGGYYNALANAWLRRFQRLGHLDDLDNAIVAYRTGLQSVQDLSMKASMFGNLAAALSERWNKCGRVEDIHDIVHAAHQALVLSPSGHRDYPVRVVVYAACLIQRFEALHDRNDLDVGIKMLRQAISDCPQYAFKHLVAGLSQSYEHYGNLEHLSEAILFSRKWLAMCPPSSISERPSAIHDLAYALCLRAEVFPAEIPGIVAEVLPMLYEELGRLNPGDSWVPPLQRTLGYAQWLSYRYTGVHADLEKSAEAFSHSLSHDTAGAVERMTYARKWIACAETSSDPQIVLRAYYAAVNLLPSIAYLGLDSASRLATLKASPQLVNDGAARALEYGRPEVALELLEQGRSVFWSSALQLRTSFHTLPDPLAQQLRDVSQKLEESGTRQPTDDEIVRRRELSVRFHTLLADARRVSGFEDFLLPLRFASLCCAADYGPVVTLMTKGASAWAIILRPQCSSAETIMLDMLSLEVLGAMSSKFSGLHRQAEDESRDAQSQERLTIRKARLQDDHSWYVLLSELWCKVVLPVIRYLGLQKTDPIQRPRLWLCPTGPFLSLPIHAAGDYRGMESMHCFSDFAIVSYTPTLSALIAARRQAVADAAEPSTIRALLIAQPEVPGQAALPHTTAEIAEIARALPPESLIHLSSSNDASNTSGDGPGVKAEVLSVLPSASILHLACHGWQDTHDPLASCFFFADGRLSVGELMRVRMPRARVAFLSACHSAASAPGDEESIYLAAAMLFVGFKSVIGTLWSMNDADGPTVAKEVYRALVVDGTFNMDAIPYALNDAVHTLRASGASKEGPQFLDDDQRAK